MLKRFLAVARKEIKHFLFDPSQLFLSIFAPAFLLVLLGYVFSFEVSRIELLIIDQDQTPLTQAYTRYLSADGTIFIVGSAANNEEVIEAFRYTRADAALIIPPGWSAHFNAGEEAPIDLILDATDAGMANTVMREITSRSSLFSTEQTGGGAAPFTVSSRYYFNPNLDSENSMIPGLIAVVLIPTIMSIALSITREYETGTFETLITTPVRGTEYLLGKLLVHLTLGIIGALLALGISYFWFSVPLRGSVWLYLLSSAAYIFAMMSICILLTRYVRSQRTVTTFILMLFFAPSFFLTDLIAPVDRNSGFSYRISRVLPATHFIDMTRGITLKGVVLSDLMPDLLTLLLVGGIFTFLGLATFRKKLV